jgi:putative flippase GtrA
MTGIGVATPRPSREAGIRETSALSLSARFAKFGRYAGVSVIAVLLAQAGLVVAYGLLRWPVPAAVILSLMVSAMPAYFLSRRYVWSGAPHEAEARQVWSFLGVAAVGSLTTIAIVWAFVAIAHGRTHNHATLTVVANGASIVATSLIWLGRYFVLDRFVFTGGRS